MQVVNAYQNTRLYSKVFQHMRPDFGILWAVCEALQPEVLAEFGCGNGRLLPIWLNSSCRSIWGLDCEEAMVREFAAAGGERVRVKVADLRENVPEMAEANVVILTSSVLKHLKPSDRHQALSALRDNLTSNTILYIDHCAHLYGVARSTHWRTYFDSLKHWWPEERRAALKSVSWRKDVEDSIDNLLYRDDTTGEAAQISTFAYSLDELRSDIAACGLQQHHVADRFPEPTHLEGMQRYIAVLARKDMSSGRLEDIAAKIRHLAFGGGRL